MIYDIIILALFLIPVILGALRGIIGSGFHSLSWVAALGLGLYGTGRLKDVFGEYFLNDAVNNALAGHFDGSAQAVEESTSSLPEFISGGLVSSTQQATDMFTETLAQMLIALITFLVIVLGVKIILRCIVTPVVSRHRHGVIGATDRMIGMLLGAAEGIILVFLFLSVLTLMINLGSPDFAAGVQTKLDESLIAGQLYDNNLLLLVTKGLF